MENPGEMMRRAAQNRRRAAPCSPASVPQTEAPSTPQKPRPSPQKNSHANYSALMRSHDRVHTCHLGG